MKCDRCRKETPDDQIVKEKEHGMSGTDTWFYCPACAPEPSCNCSACRQGLGHLAHPDPRR